MVRLSADLINRSPSYINCVHERQLDLRGNKIPAITDVGAAGDHYDIIDFSDNEIEILENFPLLSRIRRLFFSNNQISSISPNMHESIPNLETLILTNNRISELFCLNSLRDFSRLQCVALLDNPVTKKPNYRLYMINILPKLRILDFSRVKLRERRESFRLFGGKIINNENEPGSNNELTHEMKTKTTTSTHSKFDEEKLQAIKNAILNATTLGDIANAEKTLENVTMDDID